MYAYFLVDSAQYKFVELCKIVGWSFAGSIPNANVKIIEIRAKNLHTYHIIIRSCLSRVVFFYILVAQLLCTLMHRLYMGSAFT